MKPNKFTEFLKIEKDRRNWGYVALVLLAAIILETTSFVQLRMLVKTTRREAMTRAQNVLITTQYEIMDVVEQAEQAIRDNMWITQLYLDRPDSLKNVTRRIVGDHSAVVGSTVNFAFRTT